MARRICEIVFILTLEFVILHQYILPTIEHSFVHMDNRDIVRVVERLLKLAIPSTMLWLLGFYLFFHSTLNLTAELLRFGDRLFYMYAFAPPVSKSVLHAVGTGGTLPRWAHTGEPGTFLCNSFGLLV